MPFIQKQTRFLIAIFLLINIFCHLSGGVNPVSRLLTMIAMSEDHSFRIDHYVEHTPDWARTPDGHYYSNKAPGPMLLAFPVYFIVDKISVLGMEKREERDAFRIKKRASLLRFLAFLFQLLPFLWILYQFNLKYFSKKNLEGSVFWMNLCYLFGTTVSLMMSTFYGHGMGAVFLLLCLGALLEKNWKGVGFSFGFAVLSDYGGLWAIVPLLYFLWRMGPTRLESTKKFLLGGMVPGILWIWYHTVCFGSPFSLPNKFQNPQFVDLSQSKYVLWGVIRIFPNFENLFRLLFGFERGLLVTQPWILVLMALTGIRLWRLPIDDKRHVAGVFALGTFLGMLYMNASFGGWHGGLTPGPRYLGPCLPLFAIWLGLEWEQLSKMAQKVLGFSVLFSVGFSFLVYATELAAPNEPLWPYYLKKVFVEYTPTVLIRLTGISIAVGLFVLWSKAGRRKSIAS